MQQLAKWTNTKAMLAGAGDTCYQDYKQFTAKEIQQHLGVYVLNGILPFPRVEYKFQPQQLDEVHGNDFVWTNFGPNAE